MKTLFEYGSQLNSRDLNLALASLIGVGPICGFNEVKIDGNLLKVLSTEIGQSSGIYRHLFWDKVKSRFVNQLEDGGNIAQIQHACIARDGYMYIDDTPDLQIHIQNSKVVNNEVLLFAQHIAVSDPVDNPVNLVAYYNISTTSFYQNFYLPQLTGDLTLFYSNSGNPDISFKKLEDQAFVSIPSSNVVKENSVLIGIYGTGFNGNTNTQENFSIVPYNGEFPTKISYNVLVHQYLMNLGNRVSRLESK